jgi:hypothetical protein
MIKYIMNCICVGFIILIMSEMLLSYPTDGYHLTGIRRLERLRLVVADSLPGTKPPPGGLKSLADIKLNLLGARGDSLEILPAIDQALYKEIIGLFTGRHESYSLALLEITPGRPFRFVKHQAESQLSPGSVGKLCIVAGLFTELKNIYPHDPEKRRQLLRNRMVKGGKWILTDPHEIPVYDPGSRQFKARPAREDDVFSLYEWTDHMLSASANSAASVVWKEVMLLHKFATTYPPSPEQETEFFEKTPKSELAEIAYSVVNDPLRAIGIEEKDWKLGSFFTATGKQFVPVRGGSSATTLGYIKYLINLERGKIVDRWSSLEIKRLLYMTARRIRYASSPRLNDAAVYFKSGSLYRCTPEAGFECKQYQGNVENVMNSLAIVEQPDGRIYIVGLTSNVLKVNSAVEHQSLATFIDRLLQKP